MLTFRLAEEKDLENILDTYNASIPGRMATADLEPQSMEERKKWFEKHREGNRPAWVLELKGNYAGWMSVSNFYGRPAYSATVELSLYIDQAFQGKGLGKTAIAYALEKAPGLGIKTILAYVFAHNAPSLELFKKQGFEVWGHFYGVANMDGVERDLMILGRKT
jgi:L-amino acid N-acyltransferase YncA